MYTITSIKHSEQFRGSVEDAIERAKEVDEEYQPAFGTQVEDDEGTTLWDSESE